MGFCDSPKKILKGKLRHRKTSYSTGRNAGNRHRGQPKMEYTPITYVVSQPEDDVHSFISGTLFPSSWKSDEMWDTHGYIQNWYNICVREKFEGGAQPFPEIVDVDGPVITFTGDYCSRDAIRRTIPFLDGPQLDELALRSEDKLSNVVQSNTSLANFIIELIQACDGNISGIRRFRDLYEKAIKAYQKEYLRLIKAGHSAASSHWLAWNFAIKPTIKDLGNILCSISAAYKKLKWLQDHNHKVVYLDYNRDKLEDLVSFDPSGYNHAEIFASVIKADPDPLSPANGTHSISVRITGVKISYHARSKIFLDIPDHYLRGMMGISALWGAMMGLTNPVGIIWEAIPFSWLIDYFLSYRSRLFQNRNDFNLFDAGITVLGYGHSFDTHYTGDTAWFRYFGGTWIFMESRGGFKYSLYGRQAGLPFPEQTTYFRAPSDWYHFSILGALAIGFLPKRK